MFAAHAVEVLCLLHGLPLEAGPATAPHPEPALPLCQADSPICLRYGHTLYSFLAYSSKVSGDCMPTEKVDLVAGNKIPSHKAFKSSQQTSFVDFTAILHFTLAYVQSILVSTHAYTSMTFDRVCLDLACRSRSSHPDVKQGGSGWPIYYPMLPLPLLQ